MVVMVAWYASMSSPRQIFNSHHPAYGCKNPNYQIMELLSGCINKQKLQIQAIHGPLVSKVPAHKILVLHCPLVIELSELPTGSKRRECVTRDR
jgi:hypothetical protein